MTLQLTVLNFVEGTNEGITLHGVTGFSVKGLQRLPYSSHGFSDCELIVIISKLSILLN
jgi:hypothetical protein